jgi:hypothetical protein
MRIVVIMGPLLALLGAPLPAFAQAATRQVATRAASPVQMATRAASAAEMSSFAAILPLLAPEAGAGAPVFAATRAPGARAWDVSATVDAAPVRGASPLCRMRRTRFAYQPLAAAAQRWRVDGVSQYAWLGAAGACAAPARPVVLSQALPDTDVLAAYTQLGPLVQRARLLMSGNSSCAAYRSDNFRLAAMGVSAPPVGAEQMLVLRFESERGSDAQVWVRRRALALEAWHVACAPR